MTKFWLAALLLCFACKDKGDNASCKTNPVDECTQQCGGGTSQNICFPDPICESTGHWTCFCEPCTVDMASGDMEQND